MNDNPTELFESLSEAERTQAMAAGWSNVDTDSETARASIHAGQARAYTNAARLVDEMDDDQASIHDFEPTIDTTKLVRHPDASLRDIERPADERDEWEDSVLCDGVEALDDQTIVVTLIVDLPEEL